MSEDMEEQIEQVINAANLTIGQLKALRDKKGHLWAAMVEFMLEVKVTNSVVKEPGPDMIGKISSKFIIAVLSYAYSPEEVAGKLDELMADTDALTDVLIGAVK